MLRARWLGRVPYDEAHALQTALHRNGVDDHLLLLEHPHVVTLGVRADPAHVLVDPAEAGAAIVRTDRGGDVTYHGPGQLVGYPIVSVPMAPGAVPGHVRAVEQVVIDALASFGLAAGRVDGHPGVWVDPTGPRPRKIAAVGVRITKGRSMHGFALNVDPDMAWFSRIVPCGLADRPVTSMRAEGVVAPMAAVVDAVVAAATARWAPDGRVDRQDATAPAAAAGGRDGTPPVAGAPVAAPAVAVDPGAGGRARVRLRRAGTDPDAALALSARKPPWLRVPAVMGADYLELKRTVRGLGLVTVCEEAGCPNIFECWADGTATFMINGERCTRACGFCLVDTRHPLALDPGEPDRVGAAVERLGLSHAVVTGVARDDLPDGGAAAFAASVAAIRRRCPATAVEVLIPDCKGDAGALDVIFGARPDVLNHNLETVLRLHRAVRPSAGYARSLAVLARAKDAGLVTKSGIMVGLGEDAGEVIGALADLRAVGVDIVTLGQYLRPSAAHLPVARWWTPDEFERLRTAGEAMGFAHVQASPLTRSSYHARAAAGAAGGAGGWGPNHPAGAAGVGSPKVAPGAGPAPVAAPGRRT